MPDQIQVPTQITNFGIGDLLCGSAQGRSARLPANTSTTLKFLAERGDGKNGGFPFWTEAGLTVSGLAAIATSGSASDLNAGTIPQSRLPSFTGDVTNPVGSSVTTISESAVSNPKLNKFPPLTILGNSSILTKHPQYLTVADLNAMGIGGSSGSGGVEDGDKGDITVSGSGLVWTIDNVAWSKVTGRPTTLAGYGITDGASNNMIDGGGFDEVIAASGLDVNGGTF